MGDPNRFQVFSQFVARNFSPCKVADVAGGIGLTSHYLNLLDFQSTVIDPRRIQHSNNIPISYYHFTQLKRIRSEFNASMIPDYDLIVGLHPDQATEVIVHASRHVPIAVVPCCNFWTGVEDHGSPSLVSTISLCLNKHDIPFRQTALPMSGKNIVIWTK